MLSRVLLGPKASLGGRAVEDAGLADHSSTFLKLPVERWRKARISSNNSAFLALSYFLNISCTVFSAPGLFPTWKGPDSVRPECAHCVCTLGINYMDLPLFSVMEVQITLSLEWLQQ